MVGQIGDLIFQLMGKQDPQDALVAAMADGGTPGAPQGAGSTPAAVGTGGGAPVPDQTPAVYKSPPELMTLYSDLLKRQEINSSVDRGVGLIGASLAQPENRRGILSMFNGTPQGDNPTGLVNNLLTMRAQQNTASQLAARRATLPAIAEKYGLDLATATYLFDTGKLDSVIAEAEKPNNEIVQDPTTGQHYLVDKTNGSVSAPFGVPKKREIELVTDENTGEKFPVYKDTKERVGTEPTVKGVRKTEWVEDPLTGSKVLVYADTKQRVPDGAVLPGGGNTADQKDYTRAMEGKNPGDPGYMEFSEWQKEQANLKTPKTTINTGEEGGPMEKELAKNSAVRWDTEYEAASGARKVLDYVDNARTQLNKGIVAGSILSPAELQGRKLWAQIMGVPDEATTNTETFQASLKEVVLGKIKALGSGTAISDADRTFIESAVGGDITLNTDTMKRIFTILDKGAHKNITQYNKSVDDYLATYDSPEDKRKVGRMLRKVELPAQVDETGIDDLIKKYQ